MTYSCNRQDPVHVHIENRVYILDVFIYQQHVFVSGFSINEEYRGRKYSRRIFNRILSRFSLDIVLESYKTLVKYYTGLGFDILEGIDDQGYYLMRLSK